MALAALTSCPLSTLLGSIAAPGQLALRSTSRPGSATPASRCRTTSATAGVVPRAARHHGRPRGPQQPPRRAGLPHPGAGNLLHLSLFLMPETRQTKIGRRKRSRQPLPRPTEPLPPPHQGSAALARGASRQAQLPAVPKRRASSSSAFARSTTGRSTNSPFGRRRAPIPRSSAAAAASTIAFARAISSSSGV
jgi:hypothetical protein